MLLAFQFARAADPNAVLLVNEYNLENNPQKLDTFLRLIERLLNRGAPITGLGNQSHIGIDTQPGASTRAIQALAKFGLPIHVSELDVSLGRRRLELRSLAQKQARLKGVSRALRPNKLSSSLLSPMGANKSSSPLSSSPDLLRGPMARRLNL